MRTTLSRVLYATLLFAVFFTLASTGYAQDPQPTPTPTPDVSASPTPTPDPTAATDDANPAPPAATPEQDRLDLDADTDSADLPSFFKGSIDTEDYLRMRNAHNRRLRGLMDREYAPWRRNGAIDATRIRERQLRDAAAQGSAIPDPNFVGPVSASVPAPFSARKPVTTMDRTWPGAYPERPNYDRLTGGQRTRN